MSSCYWQKELHPGVLCGDTRVRGPQSECFLRYIGALGGDDK